MFASYVTTVKCCITPLNTHILQQRQANLHRGTASCPPNRGQPGRAPLPQAEEPPQLGPEPGVAGSTAAAAAAAGVGLVVAAAAAAAVVVAAAAAVAAAEAAAASVPGQEPAREQPRPVTSAVSAGHTGEAGRTQAGTGIWREAGRSGKTRPCRMMGNIKFLTSSTG